MASSGADGARRNSSAVRLGRCGWTGQLRRGRCTRRRVPAAFGISCCIFSGAAACGEERIAECWRDRYIVRMKWDTRCVPPQAPTVRRHGGRVMATKRVSSGVKTTRRKAATAAPELTDSAVMRVLETAQIAVVSGSVDPDVRRRLVAAEAY